MYSSRKIITKLWTLTSQSKYHFLCHWPFSFSPYPFQPPIVPALVRQALVHIASSPSCRRLTLPMTLHPSNSPPVQMPHHPALPFALRISNPTLVKPIWAVKCTGTALPAFCCTYHPPLLPDHPPCFPRPVLCSLRHCSPRRVLTSLLHQAPFILLKIPPFFPKTVFLPLQTLYCLLYSFPVQIIPC